MKVIFDRKNRLMKIAVYVGSAEVAADSRVKALMSRLEGAGISLYDIGAGQALDAETDMLMSIGGDGTFLSASMLVAASGVPVIGVNLGRVGFLSENKPEDVADALLTGEYSVEDRALLKAVSDGEEESYALNEFTVSRSGAAMLGVDVTIDGIALPTYWADGLIVSTSSGSTAYSLSVGGPIALPAAKVLIISPIAPHNLNVRPLVVPDDSMISVKVHSRDRKVKFTADNRTIEVDAGARMELSLAQFSLKRVRLNKSDFINALTEKLHWGEDVRNIK